MSKYLISIVGPTAIGKTALSIELANYFNADIISADSRQFYKEMTIGTAVPSKTELARAKHHFIQQRSIDNDYNVGAFERDAVTLLDKLFKTHDVVVMVGGSGLYVNAVVHGLDDFPKVDPDLRNQLNKQLEDNGLQSLQDQLKQVDPVSYNTIALTNPHRVIRALEISLSTGKPYASFLNQKKNERNFKTISIGLTAERATIYKRINKRVDIMLEEGLLEEVKRLLPKQHLNALNTVGYKELFNYFNGEWTLDFAISEIKKHTRRFAKRQLTWFKKDPSIIWIDYKTPLKDIIKVLNNEIKKG